MDHTTLTENPLNPFYFPGRTLNPNTKNTHTAMVEGQTAIGLFHNQIKGYDTQSKGPWVQTNVVGYDWTTFRRSTDWMAG